MACIEATGGCGCDLSGSNCIAVSGAGTGASPWVVSPIISPDAANGLECRGNGLWASKGPIPGEVRMWAGSVAPAGFALCNGAAYSRVTYAATFAVCGTTYGPGDGVSTFNVPNFVGRFPAMPDGSAEFPALGSMLGSKTHTLIVSEIPSHDHGGATGIESAAHAHDIIPSGTSGSAGLVDSTTASSSGVSPTGPELSNHTHPVTAQGGGAAHSILPPDLCINFIIAMG